MSTWVSHLGWIEELYIIAKNKEAQQILSSQSSIGIAKKILIILTADAAYTLFFPAPSS